MIRHRKPRRQPPWWLILTLTALVALIVAAFTVATAHPAHADGGYFDMCPSGQEGVAGGHTTCEFAENVRAAYYAAGGGGGEVIAYSPVTGDRYVMYCVDGDTVHFHTGVTWVGSHCVGGDGAEVVIW